MWATQFSKQFSSKGDSVLPLLFSFGFTFRRKKTVSKVQMRIGHLGSNMPSILSRTSRTRLQTEMPSTKLFSLLRSLGMFGRNKQPVMPRPKMSKEHEHLREEVINSRELLLKEIEKLNKKFDMTRTKKRP